MFNILESTWLKAKLADNADVFGSNLTGSSPSQLTVPASPTAPCGTLTCNRPGTPEDSCMHAAEYVLASDTTTREQMPTNIPALTSAQMSTSGNHALQQPSSFLLRSRMCSSFLLSAAAPPCAPGHPIMQTPRAAAFFVCGPGS